MTDLRSLFTQEQLDAMERVREFIDIPLQAVADPEPPKVLSPTASAPLLMDLE